MILVRTAPMAYNTGYNRREPRQSMTSYALGGCHQGKGIANDVFALQGRPQFGVVCCFIAAALSKAVVNGSSFKKMLENNNTEALLDAISESFKGISAELGTAMATIIKENGTGFEALINLGDAAQEDVKIITALKAKPKLWSWLETNGYTG